MLPLEDRLKDQDRAVREALPVEVTRAFDAFLQRLASVGVEDGALGVGDPMPGFMLPSAEAELVDSADLLADGPLVISFFRGKWCPYCNLELMALEEILPEIRSLGAELVAITPELAGRPLDTKRERGLHYTILADPESAVGMQFGIVFPIPPDLQQHYRSIGMDLASFNGTDSWFLPIPATYVVGRDGIIAHAYVDIDYRRRMEPAAILDALRQLNSG